LIFVLFLLGATLGGASSAVLGVCGPFADVAADAFCPLVLEIFTLGITTGTTPTTYDPSANVNRLQMAAFLSRSVDGVLKRGSRRAALRQFATPQVGDFLAMTTVGSSPFNVECDGADVWVRCGGDGGTVSRVRASDGKLLDTWTGAASGIGMVIALGRVFVSAGLTPGQLYMLDPSQPAGVVTTVATNLGGASYGIAYDGIRIWTANSAGSVSIVTPGVAPPFTVTTITTGFQNPQGILFDGSNMWVTDAGPIPGRLFKLDANGAILQTVTVGQTPVIPAFDGNNIWVPNANEPSISVVRASTGVVLATLTGNGVDAPQYAAFDGQRILVTNGLDGVSLWKAADFTPLGSVPLGVSVTPYGACSDGANFWITLSNQSQLIKF